MCLCLYMREELKSNQPSAVPFSVDSIHTSTPAESKQQKNNKDEGYFISHKPISLTSIGSNSRPNIQTSKADEVPKTMQADGIVVINLQWVERAGS